MPTPAEHTVVRISLRSMFAITFGLSLVMGYAVPEFRSFRSDQQWRVIATSILFAIGILSSTLLLIRRRTRVGHVCGSHLLTLSFGMEKHHSWLRWIWVLFLLPLLIHYLSDLSEPLKERYFMRWLVKTGLLALPLSYLWTKSTLGLWLDGIEGAGVEFCENGIVYLNKFYRWDSPTFSRLELDPTHTKASMQIKKMRFSLPVPPNQREAVDAIIEHYYLPARRS